MSTEMRKSEDTPPQRLFPPSWHNLRETDACGRCLRGSLHVQPVSSSAFVVVFLNRLSHMSRTGPPTCFAAGTSSFTVIGWNWASPLFWRLILLKKNIAAVWRLNRPCRSASGLKGQLAITRIFPSGFFWVIISGPLLKDKEHSHFMTNERKNGWKSHWYRDKWNRCCSSAFFTTKIIFLLEWDVFNG